MLRDVRHFCRQQENHNRKNVKVSGCWSLYVYAASKRNLILSANTHDKRVGESVHMYRDGRYDPKKWKSE